MAYVQDITKVDGNFCAAGYEDLDLEFFDATQSPFEISGLPFFQKDKKFCRIPLEYLERVSEGVKILAWHTSGVQIRFSSNASQIGLSAELRELSEMSHMPLSGNSGFDLYLGAGKDKKFVKSLRPSFHQGSINQLAVNDQCNDMRQWTLYLPLYNGVNSVKIGVNKGASIEAPAEFTIKKPILFYGHSITQGGCASRPGNSYTSQVCRWLDADMVNLGFSGSALGELDIAEVITKIDASVFVMDYDHNAPTVEHLSGTHENMFRFIRGKRPDLPVVFVTRTDYDRDRREGDLRKLVISRTYRVAKDNGDPRVWLVDGQTLLGSEDRDACTVDGCHPNDLGFYRISKGIYPYIKTAVQFTN